MKFYFFTLLLAGLCLCTGAAQLRTSQNTEACRSALTAAAAVQTFKAMGQIIVTQDKNQYEATLTLDRNEQKRTGSAKLFSGLGTTIASLTIDSAQARIKSGNRSASVADTARLDSILPEIPFTGSALELMQICAGSMVSDLAPAVCDSGVFQGRLNQYDALIKTKDRGKDGLVIDVQLVHTPPIHIIYFYSRKQVIKKVSIDWNNDNNLQITYDWVRTNTKQ